MKIRAMDWTVIVIFSAMGVIMGLLSVKRFTHKLELFLWLLFGIATALVHSKNIDHHSFLHGLLIGMSWGIINAAIQSAFYDTYLANNPSLQEGFRVTTFMPPRYFALATGPIIGLTTGVVLGGVSLLLSRIW